MRLTSELIGTIRSRVEAEFDELQTELGRHEACKQAFHLVTQNNDSTEVALVERFFRIVWLFDHCQDKSLISRATLDSLSTMAEYSLKLLDIKPYSSYLSYLHGDFLRAKARALAGFDDAWQAAWNVSLAEAMVGARAPSQEESFASHWELAEYHSHLGNVVESLEAYRKAEEHATQDEEVIKARLAMVTCLRILNETKTALIIADSVDTQFELNAEPLDKITWERHLILAQQDSDASHLLTPLRLIKRQRGPTDRNYLILACLWCYASRQRGAIDEVPSSGWIKRHYIEGATDRRVQDALSYLGILEKCYDTGSNPSRSDIYDKLKQVGPYLAELRTARPTAESTVFLAAMGRWLVRVKQRGSAALVVGDYQNSSQVLTQGHSKALFELLSDLGDKLSASSELTRAKPDVARLKTGMDRTFLYIEIFSKLTMTLVSMKTGSWLGSKDEKQLREELIKKLSHYFVEYAAGAMKGPIHKFAQILLNSCNLPAEAQENFKSVLWSRQIIPEKAMRKVFEDDLGIKIEDAFDEFNFEPIGVGSVSQVYRARLKTGQEVAVKIQLPDLQKVKEQDMAIFSKIFTVVRWALPHFDVVAIKKLYEELVESELDFRDEAQLYQKLASINGENSRWLVPRVYDTLTSRCVLTTNYIRGLNFYQFNDVATDEEKQEAAAAIYDFAIRSVLEAGMVCVDPHPANMIFSDGKIYLIDFGFAVRASSTFVRMYQQFANCHGSVNEQMLDQVYSIMRETGLIKPNAKVANADVREFLAVMCTKFNWETCALPETQARFFDLFFNKRVNRVIGTSDPEFFVCFIGVCQAFRTINKFNVPQPVELDEILAREREERAVGSLTSKISAAS